MIKDLKCKTALVTGAGKKSGIGYAIARKLAAGGAHVILADLIGKQTRQNTPVAASMDQINALAEGLAKTFKVEAAALELDVTANDSVAQLAQKVQQQFGPIHILCNNAGAVFGVLNAVYRAMLKQKNLLVLSPVGKLTYWLSRMAPGLYERLMVRQLKSELIRKKDPRAEH